MSILNTLAKIKDEGFDPRKDKINGDGRLGEGTYPVRLIEVERGADKRGYEQIVIKLEVVSGDCKGRTETLYIQFHDDLPEFVLEKNGKMFMAIAAFTGVTLNKKDLVDEESGADALKRGIGKQLLMKLRLSENKKNPEYPYRNYEFEDLADKKSMSIDIEEDDLPF